jgi:hypothetical protein
LGCPLDLAKHLKIAEGFTLGLAYAAQPTADTTGDTTDAKYGVDLGYANDAFCADLMYATDS